MVPIIHQNRKSSTIDRLDAWWLVVLCFLWCCVDTSYLSNDDL